MKQKTKFWCQKPVARGWDQPWQPGAFMAPAPVRVLTGEEFLRRKRELEAAARKEKASPFKDWPS